MDRWWGVFYFLYYCKNLDFSLFLLSPPLPLKHGVLPLPYVSDFPQRQCFSVASSFISYTFKPLSCSKQCEVPIPRYMICWTLNDGLGLPVVILPMFHVCPPLSSPPFSYSLKLPLTWLSGILVRTLLEFEFYSSLCFQIFLKGRSYTFIS